MNPSDYAFREAKRLADIAQEVAMSAAYGQIVLGLLYDEDRSHYSWLEFHLKAFDIRRKLNKEIRRATKFNNAAKKAFDKAWKMKREEDNGVRRWGSDA